MAKTIELKLKAGDLAPDFTATTQDGSKVSLSDFKGKNVVLYFYPKDDTPGCTKEACTFRDEFAEFKAKRAIVLGVSIDPVKAHAKFSRKYKLPFTLLADGRKYMGTYRVTFLIGPDGKIKIIWPEVKPQEHAKEVLMALE
jgi:peroxiredoxin Q/BCP